MAPDKNVSELAESLGADFFGVADLSCASQDIAEQDGPAIAEFPRAVSVGIALPHSIVDRLPDRAEPGVASNYRHHSYDIINQRLDHIVSRINSYLQQEGYRSYPVPASQRVNQQKMLGVFSNKMAAHLAGLGWIGKSCLLITRRMGPRVRWATCLTHAPLETTGESMADGCDSCTECVDICPASAFTGRPFRKDEPREARYNVYKCEKYQKDVEKEIGFSVCGLCLYVCPFGRRASAKAH